MNLLLEGKIYVVMGVVNKCSIVWVIVCLLNEVGVKFVFIYVDDCVKKSIIELVFLLSEVN